LGQELPYQCAVRVDEFTHEPKHTTIRATLVVQKENHKGMVIGRAGSRLKSIGTDARLALEKHLDRKVFLELFVKVHEGWIDDKALLAEYASMNEEEL
jgi:GTP-binding protein Era